MDTQATKLSPAEKQRRTALRHKREAKRKKELEKSPQASVDRYRAAKYLGVCARTVAYKMQDGSLPFVRMGPRMTRFLVKDLDQYLEKHRVA